MILEQSSIKFDLREAVTVHDAGMFLKLSTSPILFCW